MRTISFWLFILGFTAFTTAGVRAQDAATQQQIDQINGKLQDIQDAQAAQGKKIAALEKSISDLSDKLNQPADNGSASAEDLKKLASQVQDLAKKQQSDNEAIVKALEKIGKGGTVTPPVHRPPPDVPVNPTGNSTTGGDKQNGFYYEVQAGNTISAIAKAYTDQGHKVTVKQILDANPGLDAKNLVVGKKIFIPDTSAK